MSDCLFCKITNKTIPSAAVYEDDNVYAFLDINPVNPGHTLIVPKVHTDGLIDADDQVLEKLIVATKKVSKAVMKATDSKGFNIILNNGEVAGQVIHHMHFHIIPRFKDDGLVHWKNKAYKEEEQMTEMAEKIKKEL